MAQETSLSDQSRREKDLKGRQPSSLQQQKQDFTFAALARGSWTAAQRREVDGGGVHGPASHLVALSFRLAACFDTC